MPSPTQTDSAKPPKHVEIGCEFSARVTDKRNWVLCRACLDTQHSQTKGKSKALTGYFQPIIISHKSQTSPDQCLWQHDWWVCRRECQEKWSPAPYLPYFSLWVRLGVFMEKSHGRCDEHYPVIMKGTLLYCQLLQTGRQGGRQAGTCWLLGGVVHSCVYVPLYLYLEPLFIYLHYVSAVIALSNTAFIHRGKCQEVIKSNVPFVHGSQNWHWKFWCDGFSLWFNQRCLQTIRLVMWSALKFHAYLGKKMKPCMCNVWVFSLKVSLLIGQLWLVSVHVKFNQTSQVKYVCFFQDNLCVWKKLLAWSACLLVPEASHIPHCGWCSGGFSDAACNIACKPTSADEG